MEATPGLRDWIAAWTSAEAGGSGVAHLQQATRQIQYVILTGSARTLLVSWTTRWLPSPSPTEIAGPGPVRSLLVRRSRDERSIRLPTQTARPGSGAGRRPATPCLQLLRVAFPPMMPQPRNQRFQLRAAMLRRAWSVDWRYYQGSEVLRETGLLAMCHRWRVRSMQRLQPHRALRWK